VPGRSRTIFRALTGGLLAGFVALAYGIFIEPRTIRTRRYAVTVPDLPADLEGLRIAFLTDFHIHGPGDNHRATARAFAAAARYQPDLTLLGGDYFDHAIWEGGENAFADLQAAGPVFGVLGNHDLFRGERHARAIARILEQSEIRVLRNQAVTVPVRGREIIIAGVDDPFTRKADLAMTLSTVPLDHHPLVLLAHAPVLADTAPPGTTGLILSGHTHGGQIRLSPFKTLTPLDISWYLDGLRGKPQSRRHRGYHWVHGTLLFVSNGIGTTHWPIRFLAPPQVLILELTAQPADPAAPCDSPRRYVQSLARGCCRERKASATAGTVRPTKDTEHAGRTDPDIGDRCGRGYAGYPGL
jgi:predicted MPP superfamily phosphohydrolase